MFNFSKTNGLVFLPNKHVSEFCGKIFTNAYHFKLRQCPFDTKHHYPRSVVTSQTRLIGEIVVEQTPGAILSNRNNQQME